MAGQFCDPLAYTHAERRRGASQLNRRQQELLCLVGAGHTDAQIARRLGVSEGTVRKHRLWGQVA
jgi:DNA-binding CsgD family transcriptional regulator